MRKNQKELAQDRKDKPLDILTTWAGGRASARAGLLKPNAGAAVWESETAQRLGVWEEEEKRKRARNRTQEENKRDLAP
jgi:hypothetical protein